MEIKITKEKILQAAERCSTAKETLKVLFPEVFELECEFNEYKIYCYLGNGNTKYKLHRSINDTSFSWTDMHSSVAHANGSSYDVETLLRYAKQNGQLREFDTVEEFAKWLLECPPKS